MMCGTGAYDEVIASFHNFRSVLHESIADLMPLEDIVIQHSTSIEGCALALSHVHVLHSPSIC